MNTIADSFLLAHALELRLLLAFIVVPVTFAAIQIVSFVARSAGSILTKANSLGSNNQRAAAFSAAGAR